MNQETEQKYWQEAYRRFQLIDWQPPISKTEVDALHATLPSRQADENITDWLNRVLKPKTFTPFTQIIRRAASSSVEQYALPDVAFLVTEDESLRFYIFQQADNIVIKVKALGLAIDKLAHGRLGLAAKHTPNQVVAEIVLDEEGDGIIEVEDTPEMRQLLRHFVIGQLN
jgi:hypothetical protein